MITYIRKSYKRSYREGYVASFAGVDNCPYCPAINPIRCIAWLNGWHYGMTNKLNQYLRKAKA